MRQVPQRNNEPQMKIIISYKFLGECGHFEYESDLYGREAISKALEVFNADHDDRYRIYTIIAMGNDK